MTRMDDSKDRQPGLAQMARGTAAAAIDLWRSSGLLTQFLFLIVLILYGTAQITAQAERTIAARNMVESSLEVEQALARSILWPLIGNEPLAGRLDAATRASIDAAVRANLGSGYIDMIKLWGVDGRLLYSSKSAPVPENWEEPAVIRAIAGETVISVVDDAAPENRNDPFIGDLVYEVYMPIYNSSGVLIAVGEIYCSVELLVGRINTMIGEIDRIRTLVLVVGIIVLSTLIFFAQRRLNRQENALLQSLAEQRELSWRNAELLEESEAMRHALANDNERFLNQIGAELHDGPIQLLSLSALYLGQVPVQPEHAASERKAREMMKRALADLRNISVGLILPELEGASLQRCVLLAIEAIEDETGQDVPRDIAGDAGYGDKPMQVVIYRTVYESLHNAMKHAPGQGIKVSAGVVGDHFRVQVQNMARGETPEAASEPRAEPGTPGQGGISLGIIGMTKRAHSVGGQLSVSEDNNAFSVILTVPLVPQGWSGLHGQNPASQRAAQ